MDLYSSIYCDTQLSEDTVCQIVATAIHGSVQPLHYVMSDTLEIAVRQNPDRDPTALLGRFAMYLENEPSASASKEEVVEALKKILHALWSSGVKTETSCDFDHDLPNHGRA